MKKFLNDIRSAENPISGNRKIINTIAILLRKRQIKQCIEK